MNPNRIIVCEIEWRSIEVYDALCAEVCTAARATVSWPCMNLSQSSTSTTCDAVFSGLSLAGILVQHGTAGGMALPAITRISAS